MFGSLMPHVNSRDVKDRRERGVKLGKTCARISGSGETDGRPRGVGFSIKHTYRLERKAHGVMVVDNGLVTPSVEKAVRISVP